METIKTNMTAETNENASAPTYIARMESVADVAKMFNLPATFIRKLVLSGKVKSVRASSGKHGKIYVNVDSLNEYFNTNTLADEEESKPHPKTGICPIPIKL